MGWQKLVMVLVNIVFVKQNINQVLFILFTKLVNCTFANNCNIFILESSECLTITSTLHADVEWLQTMVGGTVLH